MRIQEIEADSQLNDRSNDCGRPDFSPFLALPGPFKSPVRSMFPKIDSVPQPVVDFFTRPESILAPNDG
ncbi:MAG: hypothetical protein JWO82_37 [Akkermansiaceae bacterium]|nr:hypothetical protein [Akkermansiaceae bacterium]